LDIEYALTKYDAPGKASVEDFVEDYSRPVKIRKLLSRYKKGKSLNIRLVINHIVITRNVFADDYFKELLIEMIGESYYTELNTFLVFMKLSLDFIKVDQTLLQMIKDEVKVN